MSFILKSDSADERIVIAVTPPIVDSVEDEISSGSSGRLVIDETGGHDDERVDRTKVIRGGKYDGSFRVQGGSDRQEWIENRTLRHAFQMLIRREEHKEMLKVFLKQCPNFFINHLLSLRDVKIEYFMDQGSFGKIFKGCVGTKQVAVKQMKAHCSPELIYKERDYLVYLKNKRIVNLVGSFHDNGSYLLLELCYGNLRYFAKALTDRHKIKFAYQLLDGIKWMHEKRILHCDLRPENLLVNLKSNLVISDFGSAQFLPHGFEFVQTDRSLGAAGYADMLANMNNIYSEQSDIFAAGCILYEMDTASFLMRYEKDGVPKTEYVKAAREGRIIFRTLVDPTPVNWDGSFRREYLWRRAYISYLFGALIARMVHWSREERIRAEDCVLDRQLACRLRNNGLDIDTMDSGDVHDVNHFHFAIDVTEKFEPIEHSEMTNMLMQALYYSEDDVSVGCDLPSSAPHGSDQQQQIAVSTSLPAAPTSPLVTTVSVASPVTAADLPAVSSIVADEPSSTSLPIWYGDLKRTLESDAFNNACGVMLSPCYNSVGDAAIRSYQCTVIPIPKEGVGFGDPAGHVEPTASCSSSLNTKEKADSTGQPVKRNVTAAVVRKRCNNSVLPKEHAPTQSLQRKLLENDSAASKVTGKKRFYQSSSSSSSDFSEEEENINPRKKKDHSNRTFDFQPSTEIKKKYQGVVDKKQKKEKVVPVVVKKQNKEKVVVKKKEEGKWKQTTRFPDGKFFCKYCKFRNDEEEVVMNHARKCKSRRAAKEKQRKLEQTTFFCKYCKFRNAEEEVVMNHARKCKSRRAAKEKERSEKV